MKKVNFTSLAEALKFVADHGGVKEDVNEYETPDCVEYSGGGAYGPSAHFVLLNDGSYFGVEAFSNGPLSEVTPDEDFGVNLVGAIAE